ncbi:Shikimate dehydrogenase [compost metagenome]
MITLLVGHRGTGKSELIKRIGFYLRDQDIEFIDLDDEVEKKIGKTIRELFADHGETYFRELERQLFLEILQKPHKDMYLVAGAGFDLSIVPEDVRVLWVRRRTDQDGRIFLDRPRLNPELSPIDEFKKRASVRENSYAEASDEVYLIPEGLFENKHHLMAIEKALLTHSLENIQGGITLTADLFRKESRWQLFKERLSGKGLDFFELRDDFLTTEQILRVLQEMPHEKFVFSFRKKEDQAPFFQSEEGQKILSAALYIDWPLELGEPVEIFRYVPKEKLILSCHEVGSQRFDAFADRVAHLKYAPVVGSYEDLQAGHQWQRAHPASRSFLPRSLRGEWVWYRLYMKGRQLVNFWREGEGSALDQPSLFEWTMTPAKPTKFAAVLGDPVYHSFTPVEQSEYFAKKSVPVFAIRIDRLDWNRALPFLQALGLTWAAVTAPHKENAAKLCPSSGLSALNTLYFNGRTWLGTSTDDEGFLELIEGVGMLAPLQQEIFVWGGGGTLSMIQKALPQAIYYSSRTGHLRVENAEDKDLKPKVLIWAAPRGEDTKWPPTDWKPALILDLNYKEDSMGREYAQMDGTNYTSGLGMFLAQARGQRVFWSRCEEQE